ncbi:MAG: hypothetical protein JNK04_09915 [Myxococcales bacterium]|nr:hypothetical protein [Myxococcales bacterium]
MVAPIFGLLIPSVIVFSGWDNRAAPLAIVPFVLGLAFFLLLFRSSSVRIGVDGLRHKWLGNERFHAWHEVAAIERWNAPDNMKPYVGLKLVLKDGEEVVIGAGQEGWNADAADQLILRAQQSWAAHREATESEHLPSLDRGDRDGVAWVNHLRAIGAGGGGHQRDAFVGPEALLRVVEDAAQPAAARASALVAAREHLSPEEVDRVRIVANTTVDDPLRFALDRALDPVADERALAEALLALESPRVRKA